MVLSAADGMAALNKLTLYSKTEIGRIATGMASPGVGISTAGGTLETVNVPKAVRSIVTPIATAATAPVAMMLAPVAGPLGVAGAISTKTALQIAVGVPLGVGGAAVAYSVAKPIIDGINKINDAAAGIGDTINNAGGHIENAATNAMGHVENLFGSAGGVLGGNYNLNLPTSGPGSVGYQPMWRDIGSGAVYVPPGAVAGAGGGGVVDNANAALIAQLNALEQRLHDLTHGAGVNTNTIREYVTSSYQEIVPTALIPAITNLTDSASTYLQSLGAVLSNINLSGLVGGGAGGTYSPIGEFTIMSGAEGEGGFNWQAAGVILAAIGVGYALMRNQ